MALSETFATDGATSWTPTPYVPNWPTTGELGSESPLKVPRSSPYSDTYHEAPDVTPEPVPAPATTDTPTSEIPEQILQVAWFLMALINEHPDPNQGLLREIQQQPIGQLRDLRTDRVDHAALATLCADSGIAASYLSRQQAANQEMVI